jgi:hypothetical protein
MVQTLVALGRFHGDFYWRSPGNARLQKRQMIAATLIVSAQKGQDLETFIAVADPGDEVSARCEGWEMYCMSLFATCWPPSMSSPRNIQIALSASIL